MENLTTKVKTSLQLYSCFIHPLYRYVWYTNVLNSFYLSKGHVK